MSTYLQPVMEHLRFAADVVASVLKIHRDYILFKLFLILYPVLCSVPQKKKLFFEVENCQ